MSTVGPIEEWDEDFARELIRKLARDVVDAAGEFLAERPGDNVEVRTSLLARKDSRDVYAVVVVELDECDEMITFPPGTPKAVILSRLRGAAEFYSEEAVPVGGHANGSG